MLKMRTLEEVKIYIEENQTNIIQVRGEMPKELFYAKYKLGSKWMYDEITASIIGLEHEVTNDIETCFIRYKLLTTLNIYNKIQRKGDSKT